MVIPSSPIPPIRYVAVISNVREVSLLGTADLAYWKKQVREIDLHPFNAGGKAQLLIGAIASQYKGIRFRELSISVLVCLQEDGFKHDGYYLAHAFNSSRLFAFVERTFFRTPHWHAAVQVDCRLPASIQATYKNDVLVRAQMIEKSALATRMPCREGDHCWEGPIFLPSTKSGRPGNVFHAKLSGHIRAYPFSPSMDMVELASSSGHPILRALTESGFAGIEWRIRESGVHARSKTLARTSQAASLAIG
jgi:hypothetical protein